MSGDDLVTFEEQNWDWLTEKFMKIPAVIDLWAEFVEREYEKRMPDEDIGRDR